MQTINQGYANARKILDKTVFTSYKARSVEGRFDGGEVGSDDGLILMREVDLRLGLIKAVSGRLEEGR